MSLIGQNSVKPANSKTAIGSSTPSSSLSKLYSELYSLYHHIYVSTIPITKYAIVIYPQIVIIVK